MPNRVVELLNSLFSILYEKKKKNGEMASVLTENSQFATEVDQTKWLLPTIRMPSEVSSLASPNDAPGTGK
jgi:hypothetical protein